MSIDTTQILLISAISIMTVIFTIVGIQLIFILRDARILITKMNTIVHELNNMGVNMNNSYSEVLGFFSGIKNIFNLVDTLSKKRAKK